MVFLLLLADAAAPVIAPGIDLNVMWQQMLGTSPLACVLLFLLLKSNKRVEVLETRILSAFEAHGPCVPARTVKPNVEQPAMG